MFCTFFCFGTGFGYLLLYHIKSNLFHVYTAAIAAAYNPAFSILHIGFSLGCLGKAGSYWRAGFFNACDTALELF
jgi:hypothetical protein